MLHLIQALDDSISLSGTEFGYDEELDGFYICSDVDSIVNVTFQNLFSNTEGIDSVIVYTNLNFTQTYYSSLIHLMLQCIILHLIIYIFCQCYNIFWFM